MWNITGHTDAIAGFEVAIARDALPQSLLFVGRAGAGKTTLAIELAKALNCTGQEPPCQTCLHCRQISAGSHPDVAVMEPADGKDSISIAQVRALRDAAALRAFQGRTKVYIISGAEALTPQAADALLKTLEEPQPQVVIILTASEAEALPSTVVSRCRVVPLRPVPAGAIRAVLEEIVDHGEAERIARLARGNVGWAMRAAKSPKLVSQQEELASRLGALPDLDLAGRLDLVESLTAERRDRNSVRRSLEVLLALGRDLLRAGHGLPAETATPEQEAMLARQAGRLGLAQIRDYIESIRLAMDRIDQNVDPRLTLEALVTSLP